MLLRKNEPIHFERKPLSTEEATELLDKIADTGRYFLSADEISTSVYSRIFDTLDLDGKNVVSVGAGWFPVGDDDRMLSALEGRGVNFFPVDIDHLKMRSWLLPDPSEESVTIPVMANGLSLPFADNSMDGYVTVNLINDPKFATKENVEKLLEEAHRVLKSDAFLIISTFGYVRFETVGGETIYRHGTPDIQVTKGEIWEILESRGFESIRELPREGKSEKELSEEFRATMKTPEIANASTENSVRIYAKKRG